MNLPSQQNIAYARMSGIASVLGQPQAPRNTEQITAQAQNYEYDARVSLAKWLHTAHALLQQGKTYSQEGDDEMTYWLLFRHAHLILTNLTRHPEYKDPAFKTAVGKHNTEVNKNLQVLEDLKKKINERYDRYQTIIKERDARRQSQQRKSSGTPSLEQFEAHLARQQPVQLQAREYADLAVQVAAEAYSGHAASGATQAEPRKMEKDDLSRQLQSIGVQINSSGRGSVSSQSQLSHTTSSAYNYPSVPSKHTTPIPVIPGRPASPPVQYPAQSASPPPIPPKAARSQSQTAPARPDKIAPFEPPRVVSPPRKEMFVSGTTLENGTPLRPIFLPQNLRGVFLEMASDNTSRNLETCAFLVGRVTRNMLVITSLVFPAQTATSDTCEMEDESQLFDYVDGQGLLTFGWIHTHPTQTCFMSSRDLHTHAPYQTMMPEFISIVCAPSKGNTREGGDWGIFRLTDPPGKEIILKCNNPGIFHPHESAQIYTDALSQKGGHVMELPGGDFSVKDMRVQK